MRFYFGLDFANFQYRAGMKSRFSKVEVARPPMITMAIGCSISWPCRVCESAESDYSTLNRVMAIKKCRSGADFGAVLVISKFFTINSWL